MRGRRRRHCGGARSQQGISAPATPAAGRCAGPAGGPARSQPLRKRRDDSRVGHCLGDGEEMREAERDMPLAVDGSKCGVDIAGASSHEGMQDMRQPAVRIEIEAILWRISCTGFNVRMAGTDDYNVALAQLELRPNGVIEVMHDLDCEIDPVALERTLFAHRGTGRQCPVPLAPRSPSVVRSANS